MECQGALVAFWTFLLCSQYCGTVVSTLPPSEDGEQLQFVVVRALPTTWLLDIGANARAARFASRELGRNG
jgi:hypothetical protein